MKTKAKDEYLLRDDDNGGWWFYVGSTRAAAVVTADGKPIEMQSSSEKNDRWYFAKGEIRPKLIQVYAEPKRVITEYVLRDGFEPSEKYPAKMDGDEYRRRIKYDYSTETALDPIVAEMYEKGSETMEPPEAEDHPMRLFIELVGAPPGKKVGQWHGRLPYSLNHDKQFLHLFPGYLDGFRAALEERLKTLPTVDKIYSFRSTEFTVYIKYAYEWEKPKKGQKRSYVTDRRASRIMSRINGVFRPVQWPAG